MCWLNTGKTRKATNSLMMSSSQSPAPWIRSPSQRTAPNKRTSYLFCLSLNNDFSSLTMCTYCTKQAFHSLSRRSGITALLWYHKACLPWLPLFPLLRTASPVMSCGVHCAFLASDSLLQLHWGWSSLLPLVLGTHSSCTKGWGRRGLILFCFATTIHPIGVLYKEICHHAGGWGGSLGCVVL